MDKYKGCKKKLYIEWLVWISLFILLDVHGIYKYIVVSMVSALIVVVNWRKFGSVAKDLGMLIPVVIYCGIGFLLAVLHNNITSWTIKTIVFWLLPVAFSLLVCLKYNGKKTHMVDVQFWACVIAYLGTKIGYILINGEFESPFAFVFGAFILYYVYRKKWRWSALAALLMYFANKRIAVLAVFVCLILMLFLKLVKYNKKCITILWGLLSLANCIYIYFICSGILEKLCDLFGIATSYRMDVYMQLAKHIPANYYIGKGIGTANVMIQNYVDKILLWAFENPHNDILKTFIELGTIGLILFMSSYLLIFYIEWKKDADKRATSQLFVTFVYFMLLMTTDNVSIYILFLVPMYSICFALTGEKEELHENHAK